MVLWVGWKHLFDAEYQSLVWGLNLGIHEFGHLAFRLLGSEFWHAAGGTILQLGVPTWAVYMFRQQKDWFAVSFAVVWLATNWISMAQYMATTGDDVHVLFLVAGATEAHHDWVYLFNYFGVIDYYGFFTWLSYFVGASLFALGLGLMGWVLRVMYHNRS